ncbi:MAG: DUF4340 domain-containing protein [Planctomycetes bacterium]|nr:DUF4340 domain-containing protein [Planctomycetota bacterium]
MNHNQKTLCFVGTALVVGMIAFFTRPSSPGVRPNEQLGTKLYAKFDDPLAVTSLEIVKYDEDSFAITDFNLTQVEGVWSITSHDNYPADAKDQVADAASSVMDLTILGIATDKASEHELFGVVEPDREKINVGATGVGTLVTMKNAEGNDLARMIIGKKVPDKDELRYVRKAGQDRVYTVKVDTGKLSTKFEDWIEKDLLKLDAFKLSRVTLNDYAIVDVRVSTGRLVKEIRTRSEMTFAYEDSKWMLKDLKQPNDEKELVSVQLADGEEPNTTTLNDLKNALDDLEIVDVKRKPEQLAANFKSGKPLEPPDRDGTNSLIERGFFPQVEDGKLHIYSDAGEVFAGMNDGVEYVLYFGNIAGGGVSGSQDDAEKDEQKKDTESKDDSDDDKDEDEDDEKKEVFGLNRYILVSVRFNADLIPKPEIKPLPPVEAQKPAEQKSEPSSDTEKSTDQSKENSEKNETSADSKTSKSQEDEKPQNGDSDKSADEKKSSSEDEAKQKADEEKSKADAEKAKRDAERKKIEEENKKAQEDYEKKLKAGQESVRKLNYRFADWYFVISEDVYKKIHLSKDDVLKKKEEKKEDSGSEDLPSGLNDILPNFNPSPN